VKGFLRNNDKLILITATSVSNTARTAEPVGTLIMGRIISEDTVRDWGKVLTNTIDLSLYDPSSSQLFASQKNTDTLRSVYIPFKDPRGDVVAHVELAFPRTAYLKGIAARNQIIFATLLIGAVFLALTYLLLNTLLGRRFNVLQKQLIGIVDDPLHAKPVCSEGNDELSMLGAAFNKVLLSLAEHRQEAQRANAAKSRFLANMSHEIRTPINGVLGMLELLTTTDLKAEQLEYAQLAKNSVIDLTKIVNDILDLSKIEAQKIVVEKAPFSLNQILDEIWKPTEITASDKGLVMVKVVDTEVPEYLNGDSGKIKQILLNLLTNSVKFTNCGGIFVLVSAKETENAGLLKIECIVSDTGRGFSESDSARLFKPFEQVDGSDTRTTKGKGLGLTISRQLASLMDGTLEARSAPGVGACFILALPLEPAFQFTTKGESPVVEWWNMGTRQCNILVAEDNGVNQTLVQRILEKAGHLVTVVSDGQAAVHCCSHNNFDVVLMDIQMPKLSGLDATKLIKADPKNANLPIIALTASVLDQDRDLYLQAGMAGVVAKPLRPIDLISAINHHMHCQTGPREK